MRNYFPIQVSHSKCIYMKSRIALSLLVFGLQFSCEKPNEDSFFENPELQTADAKAFISNNNGFALNFFRSIAEKETKENYMVSPISLSMALGMVHNGAAGETKTAFDGLLGKGTPLTEINNFNALLIKSLTTHSNETSFDLANAIWIQKEFPVEEEFVETNKTFYKSQVTNIDFTDKNAVKEVNDWVERNTRGKIKEVVKNFDSSTRLFLANAIYFNSKWKYRFNANKTEQTPFYISETNSKEVPMMNIKAEVSSTGNDLFSSIVLPYEGERFEMVILLPKYGITTNTVAESLNLKDWNNLFAQNQVSELQISIPRFKLEYENKLEDELEELGLGIAFTDNADFSNINKTEGLQISDVFQKTFIEVNEEGTEAAAVTGVTVVTTSASPSFYVNRPFLYVIREKFTGTICFMGRVGNPSSDE